MNTPFASRKLALAVRLTLSTLVAGTVNTAANAQTGVPITSDAETLNFFESDFSEGANFLVDDNITVNNLLILGIDDPQGLQPTPPFNVNIQGTVGTSRGGLVVDVAPDVFVDTSGTLQSVIFQTGGGSVTNAGTIRMDTLNQAGNTNDLSAIEFRTFGEDLSGETYFASVTNTGVIERVGFVEPEGAAFTSLIDVNGGFGENRMRVFIDNDGVMQNVGTLGDLININQVEEVSIGNSGLMDAGFYAGPDADNTANSFAGPLIFGTNTSTTAEPVGPMIISITNEASGVMRGATITNIFEFDVEAIATTFTNDGSISAAGITQFDTAAFNFEGATTFRNNSDITVDASLMVDGVANGNFLDHEIPRTTDTNGIPELPDLDAGRLTFVNSETGTIAASGNGISFGAGSISNAGTMSFGGTGIEAGSAFIGQSGNGGTVTIDNSGEIRSGLVVSGPLISVSNANQVTVNNTGIMDAGFDALGGTTPGGTINTAPAFIYTYGDFASNAAGTAFVAQDTPPEMSFTNAASGELSANSIFNSLHSLSGGTFTFVNDGSIQASGSATGAAFQAQGATEFTNNGSITVDASLAGNIEATGFFYNQGTPILFEGGTFVSPTTQAQLDAQALTFVNSETGVIETTGDGIEYIVGTITNNGSLTAGGTAISANYSFADTIPGNVYDITNTGTLQGATGIEVTSGGDLSLLNSGLIESNATGDTIGYGVYHLDAVSSVSSMRVVNEASGIIRAEGTNQAAVFSLGTTTDSFLDNAGVIEGVVLMNGVNASSTLINSGTIQVASDQFVVMEGQAELTNNGVINAGIFMGFGGDLGTAILTNNGSITGNVAFGDNADVLTLGDGSTLTGIVDAGGGEDTLTLLGSGTLDGSFTGFETLDTASANEWRLLGENSSFGAIDLQSGLLQLGDFATVSSLNVASGATFIANNLTANATIGGDFSVGDNGVVSAVEFNGDLTLESTSTLFIDALDNGTADRLSISGSATLESGTLATLSNDAAWSVAQSYTIISTTDGLTGTFGDITNNLEFLNPSLEYTANDVILTLERNTPAIQEDILETTNAQQVSVATRVVPTILRTQVGSRIASAMSFRPGVASLLGGNQTGMNAGDESDDGITAIWMNITPSRYDQIATLPGMNQTSELDGESVNALVGFDRMASDRLIVGAFVGYEDARVDFVDISGRQENDGLLFGAYAGLAMTDHLYTSVNASWANLDNELEERAMGTTLAEMAEYDSSRYTLGADVNAFGTLGNFGMLGQVAYNYTSENFDTYTTNNGIDVALEDVKLGRVSFAGELNYAFEKVIPYLSLTYEKDVVRSEAVEDSDGALVSAGLRYYGDRFRLEAYGSTIEGRDNENHYMIGINGSYAL